MANPIEALEELFQGDLPFDEIARRVCGVLRNSFPHYSWVGIYMIEEPETLVLKAWDGPQATEHLRIPVGEGICGRAAREEKSVVVDDVRKEDDYLPCFLQTRSEIVAPIFLDGTVVGEIDIDGDEVGAYNETDRLFLEWCAGRLGRAYGKRKE
jgi:GAF domain-containing protein